MFYKDTRPVYRLRELDALAWLDHGFGTRLAGSWTPGPLATLRQVHSNLCVCADGAAGCLGQGDALLSRTPGRYLGIRTADCLPLLIADERLHVVAAVHAGWRGTAASIAVKAVEAMAERFSSRPEDLIVAVGPGICGKCYTVGPDVAGKFRHWFPERSDLERETTLDLAEANRRQLIAAGVPAGRIHTGAPCTLCQAEDFHSHRRSPGKAGRMLSAIAIR